MKKKVILTSNLDEQAKLATPAVADKCIELCDLAQSGFFTLSENGEILDLNLYGSQMLGKERQDLKNSLFGLFVSDDTKPIYNLFLRKVFTSGIRQSCKVTLTIDSNTPVYVHLTGNAIENEKKCIVNVVDVTEQKKTEESLHANNLFLQTLLEAIPVPVFYKDGDGRYIGVNKSFETFFGQTSKELTGKTVFDIASAELAEIYHKQDMEILQQPGVQVYDSQVKDNNGVLHDVVFHKASFMDLEGNVSGLIGVILDITDRKRTEKSLFESEANLNAILQSTADGILAIDNSGKVIKANERFKKLWNIPQALLDSDNDKALLNFVLDQLIDPDQFISKVKELYNSVDEDLDILHFKDGRIFERFSEPIIMSDSLIGRVWSFRDITEHKQAEEALINERSLFRTIIDLIPDAVYVKDIDGQRILANPKEVQLTGKNSENDVLGKTDLDLLPDTEAKRALAEDQFVLQTGKSLLNIDGTLIDNEGRLHYLSGAKVALRDLHGNITGIVGLTRDITERKLAEETLKESEVLYRNLVMKMPDGVYKSTHDGKFIDVNPALIKMLGYDSKEELMAIDIKAQLYFDTSDRESLVLQEKLEEMGIYRLKKKDGSGIWVEDHGWYNFDEKGEIISHEGITRDVTDRKHAEDLLQMSEEQYRTLIDNIGEGIGFVNNDEHFEFANMAAEKIFGVEPGGLVGMSLDQFVSPEQYYFLQKETELRSQGKKSVYELEIIRPNGEKRTILLTAVAKTDKDGGFIGTYGLFSDITDRKLAAEELAHQQYLMQTLMDNLPDHIYFKDLKSKFVRISKSHALLFGLDGPDLAIGKTDFDFFTGEHSQQAYDDEQKIIQTGQPLSIIERETFHDRPDRWVSTIKMPFLDKNEKIIGTFGISRDVTERKFAEELIKLKNEELQKANAEKDKFFSIIAHDLRSPFNSFLGYTEMMVDDLDNMNLKEIQFMAGELKKSANNLYNLLENLLEWSRIERGITGFDPKTFLLMPKITDSLQSVLESSNKKGIEISLNIPEDMEVFADENMLKSTIRNLTTNAVKFTPKGGKVAISATPDDNFVEISIKDNGIGMKKDRLDKLFKLTEQTSRPGTEGEPSSGLGLILCKDFVEKHGGKIWVESEEGKGSVFKFTVPMKGN